VERHVYPDYCFSDHYNDPIKGVREVQIEHYQQHFIKYNVFSPWYSWTITHLALNNNHSLLLVKVHR